MNICGRILDGRAGLARRAVPAKLPTVKKRGPLDCRNDFDGNSPPLAAQVTRAAYRPRSYTARVTAKLASRPEASGTPAVRPETAPWVDRFNGEIRKGSDILVQALEREGVDQVFAYPGGASMEIHQALTRSDTVVNYLCRHEQGEIFAAEGYAKATGRVGVCIATSGPGATNLVTGLADAMMDSVPLVAITGQVPRRFIGTDAFQETPIVEITRQITKHNFLVMDIKDLPRVMREAFILARSGRPGPVIVDVPKDIQQQLDIPDWHQELHISGPVLVDVPKDIQQQLDIPDWHQELHISGYIDRLPEPPNSVQLMEVIEAIKGSKKPVIYYGGGCSDARDELREFHRRTGIPITSTLMGLGTFPTNEEASLSMLGMHGTYYANYAIDSADLLIALGVRFDDRVTGKLEAFAARARIVHIDIDAAELGKNKTAHVSVNADVKASLRIINRLLETEGMLHAQFAPWREEMGKVKTENPMRYPIRGDVIVPQAAIELLGEMTKGEAIITTGVGQHQMFAAQWYPYIEPRRWITSGGLGSMGFGLPSALGAAVAFDGKNGREKRVVIDIDGDGSFLMNCQEMATIFIEQLDVKIFLINNQHLGMVVQWEDRFYKANRAHTYLGKREAEWSETNLESDIYPDFVKMAESFSVPAKRVINKADLRGCIQEMLDTPGPYLLEIMVPHIEHVLPMIPGGGTFADIIVRGDGADTY
eukprot:gene18624-25139_t